VPTGYSDGLLKAMPVILTGLDEIEAWMTAPWEIARELQRPLADSALVVI